MSYVYVRTEKAGKDGAEHDLYTVGFYCPEGRFIPDSDHATTDAAAKRVNFLNGHVDAETIRRAGAYDQLVDALRDLERTLNPVREGDDEWWMGWHDKLVAEGVEPNGTTIRRRCAARAAEVLKAVTHK